MSAAFDDLQPVDPRDGRALTFTPAAHDGDGFWQGRDSQRWPQIDHVLYLRAGREARADEAAALLENGRRVDALGALLADTDDFAPAAPDLAAASAVAADVGAGRCSALAAMRRLEYGPVADYFAMRPSTPTFLSGLELLAETLGPDTDPPERVIEIACGIGHFLDHLSRHGVPCAGSDVTFSKLWLARRFLLAPAVPLICADLVAGATFPWVRLASATATAAPASVFCHDAFYFFADKSRAARRLQTLAGHDGRTLLGHVHLRDFDHGGIAGNLLSAAEYTALFDDPRVVFEDAALTRALLTERPAEPASADDLTGHEAMALIAGAAPAAAPRLNLRNTPARERMFVNPLLAADADDRLAPLWPTPAFAREYIDADYLHGERAPAITAAGRRGADLAPEWARRRTVLPASYIRLAVEPRRWAVIGCGWVARDYVVPALAHTPSARLAALCDPDADKRAQCRWAAGAGSTVGEYAELAALLRDAEIDAVYIATPNDAHAAIALQAAAAGCHVFCEKPMATRPHDARRMIDACERAGVRYATAFDQRFHEAHHVLRTAVTADELGLITQARIHYACQVDAGWAASPGDADNWRLDRGRAGGGAVIDLAPHALDLLAFVLDDEPVELDLMLQPRLGAENPAAENVDAGGVLGVRTAGGCLASIHVSYQCPEYLPRREIELIGTRGGARAINTMGQTPGGSIEWRGPEGARIEHFEAAAELSPFVRQLEAFSAALIAERAWPFAAARDLRHFELLFAALARAEQSAAAPAAVGAATAST